MNKGWYIVAIGLLAAAAVAALFASGLLLGPPPGGPVTPGDGGAPAQGPVLTTFVDLTGCVFREPPTDPLRPPTFRLLTLPDFPGSYAIWGATGRDAQGRVYIAGCSANVPIPSAHLFEYDPEQDRLTDLGDVISELRRAGVAREGEGQMKIHSKIVQAEDGHLYFASMDEQGERTNGSQLPTWGGHLWRLRLPEKRWEHLLASPEALIAVSAAGRWVYALGYFDHVLYQYDCRTGKVRSVHVGAAGGHISRNFLTDHRGHAFVPRLKPATNGTGLVTTLVELDPDLRELAETPIEHYSQSTDDDSHGIVSFQPLADRSIVFATDQGFLYRVAPGDGGAARVTEAGWFHPRGEAYVASMFTFDGQRHLLGLSQKSWQGGERYEWLVFDLATGKSTAVPVQLPDRGAPMNGMLLYGSVTRDNEGAFYVVGVADQKGRSMPVLYRASLP